MKKRVLSLILVSAMVLSLAACGGNGNTDTPVTDEPSVTDQTPSSDESTSEPDAAETPQPIAQQIEGMTYDESSTYLYEKNMGDFYGIYMDAKDIVDDNDKRFAMMAIAEAKLMADAVLMPTTSQGGGNAITHVAPYTVSSVLWGNDADRVHQAVITTEPIKKEDIAALRAKWAELQGTGTYEQAVKDYLTEQGYEIKDTFNDGSKYSEDPQIWDILATSRAVDAEVLVHTFDGLYEYDIENVQQPALAESYTVSDDGLTYTFKLREGVEWVDSQGRKVADLVADDFVAGMQHMLDAQGGLEWLVDGTIKNAGQYISGEVTDFSQVGVKALDDHTVEYTLEQVTPYFMSMLGYSIFAPMSRTYYESQGGQFGADFDSSAATYTYAQGPDSIAYCGPYVITNWTAKNTIVFKANESYWNADKINIHALTWVWEDGSDATKYYNDLKAGVVDAASLNSNSLELAKEDGWFDQYAYVSLTNATSYCGFINLHRQAFANFNDPTMAVSTMSDDDKARTFEAVNNVHFRRALFTAMDRGAYNSFSVGEDLKYNRLRNTYTPGNFVTLSKEVTVDINGTATTFPAGTFYGEIMQAQLDADGVKINVWNSENASSDGFDGWYDPAYAASELELAIAELAEVGVVVDESNPIVLEWPYRGDAEVAVNRTNAVKQSVENALGGKVVLSLIECPDVTAYNNTQYFTEVGSDANYDFSDGSGWSPDYGDPSSYLDTILPDYAGYMTKTLGVF